jgi:hypothetical protein
LPALTLVRLAVNHPIAKCVYPMGALVSARGAHIKYVTELGCAARMGSGCGFGKRVSASAATPIAVMPAGKVVKGSSVSSWWAEVPGWSGCGLEDFDGALGSGGFCELPVAGEQGGVQGFGEGYVGRVVDGEVVP